MVLRSGDGERPYGPQVKHRGRRVVYAEKTKGKLSASERVNELLRRAIVAEQYQLLEQEAAAFFAGVSAEEREEAAAYLEATTESLKRE